MKTRSRLKDSKFTPFDEVQKSIFRDFPKTAELWRETEPQRKVSLMLVQLRKAKGLSAKHIVERTGWDKAFVSRLESGRKGIPASDTVARYAEACGVTVGFVIGEYAKSGYFRFLDGVTLHTGLQEQQVNSFERLANKKLKLAATSKEA